ncbi:MAG TPA: type II toxin-antitoxin system RelE/ParE family toxin [Casimicrobiaceae bacterium]|nr:type II toxin-antitoxin system RelE/ParE family toxin [Casimicrobiaceae bacterium]
MAAYSVLVRPSAAAELDHIGTKRERQRIISRIRSLVADPRPPGCEKLAGAAGLFRVRQGHYRVVYRVDDSARVVDVVKSGHRREVHRASE